jgi:pyoverdine/dityrosine biosynthesis protein Dit1
MNDVIKQTSEQSRSDHQDLLQRLTAMINMSTATTILRLGEHNSHIQQQTAQRLDVVERMLLRTNATDQCEAFDEYREALNDFNRSIQWVRSRVDHLITTSGRRRLVSSK